MQGKTVEIATGKIHGITEKDVYCFKGIPYGGSTGGINRFKPPTPVKPWKGVRDASQYGQACWQAPDASPQAYAFMGPMGINAMGEDCLFLNVWTPGLNDNKKRPVMVWLHGGGFFAGSGDHLPIFNGASLSSSGDVVVVTLNHRLGVLGYLYLEELAGEQFAGSGNAGMLDIVQALKWVKENIAVFGGNPSNVTIFGESGGGGKVGTILAMPSAKGLVHKAISESGPGVRQREPGNATEVAKRYLAEFDLKPQQAGRLREMCTDMIYAGWASLSKKTGGMLGGLFAPVVDGKTLPCHPYFPEAAPSGAKVPLLIGTNTDEMAYMYMQSQPQLVNLVEKDLRTAVEGKLVDPFGIPVPSSKIDEFVRTYRKLRPSATPYEIVVAITSDRMRIGAIRAAERKIAANTPVYMYLFTWESPFNPMLGACHSLELPFVFNNVDPPIGLIGNSRERFKIAGNMSQAWIAFARSGNPSHKGIPEWPCYSLEKRETMTINVKCKVENDPREDERKAWDHIG